MSEAQQDTLVTQDMIDRKGVWGNERVSPPISASDIRKWAIATYWPEKPPAIYWDDEYARTSRYGGIIAPPDFNPFAWPVERPQRPAGAGGQRGGRGRTGLNGGQTDTYGVPMRPGDVIRSRTRLKEWNEREGRMGLTLYTYTETEWRNQDDELVRTRISIGIRY
jgi:acyl dehydratase